MSLWRKRYAEHGITGLHNELKPGRPRSTGEDEIVTLINTALTRKPSGETHCQVVWIFASCSALP